MKLTPIAEALSAAGVRAPAWAHRMLHASPRVVAADQASRDRADRGVFFLYNPPRNR